MALLPEWKELFNMGAKPLADRVRYPSKAELLKALEACAWPAGGGCGGGFAGKTGRARSRADALPDSRRWATCCSA